MSLDLRVLITKEKFKSTIVPIVQKTACLTMKITTFFYLKR